MSSVIGAILGALAGYFGGKVDMILIRISEIFQAFPQLVLVMMLVAIVNKRGLGNLLFIFVFTGWMTTFRMVRNEFMSLKSETYVKAVSYTHLDVVPVIKRQQQQSPAKQRQRVLQKQQTLTAEL